MKKNFLPLELVFSVAFFAACALFVSLSARANGAIAFDVSASSTSSGVANTTTTITVGNGSNRIVLVNLSWGSASALNATTTFGGATMTLIASSSNGTVYDKLYYLLNPSVGVNAVSSTLSATTRETSIEAVSYSGVDQTTPIGATSTFNSAAATSTAKNITSTFVNSWLVDGCSVGEITSNTVPTSTAQGSQTQRNSTGKAGSVANTAYAGCQTDLTTAATGTYTMGEKISTTTFIGHVIAELKPGVVVLPTTPGTPTYASIATSTLTVNWTAATGTTYYNINESTNGNSFSQISTTTLLTYSATSSPNKLYWYQVSGTNSTGTGPLSASSSVLALPDIPGTPTYTSISTGTVVVNWTLPTGGASSTKIEKSTDGNTFAQVATSSGTTYNATGTPALTYWYRVRATNATGDGIYSASSSVTMAALTMDATSVTTTIGGDGAKSGDSVTITGTSFGTSTVGNRATCNGGAATGCIKFIVGGTDTVADPSVTAWTNTSITFTVSSTLLSNGGAAALQVWAAGASDTTPLAFYVYPNITSISSLGGGVNGGAREYNASDTDGLIYLAGDHFGSSGTSSILGSAATLHNVAEGVCGVSGYTSSSACFEVPTAISNSSYTGSIQLSRTADAKNATSSNFRVLPRITSNTPSNASSGVTIQISGDHFCQSGTCPVSPNRASATNNVVFGESTANAVVILTSPTNSTSTWTVPLDWNSASNTIEVIGGGGGGDKYVSDGGDGGGGGAYSKIANLSFVSGNKLIYQVGMGGGGATAANTSGTAGGDTWFNGATFGGASVAAHGGGGGNASVPGPGAGGASSTGMGTTRFAGGIGGNGSACCSGSGAGGGGGAGGKSGNGGSGADDGNLASNKASGGGGGADNGANGARATSGAGGNGGNSGPGGSGGTHGAPGGGGSNGGGGGGANGGNATVANNAGGAGGNGTEWDASDGSGGGGAGSADSGQTTGANGGAGGTYGGGGGGGGAAVTTAGNGGNGAQGVIVITYTPLASAQATSSDSGATIAYVQSTSTNAGGVQSASKAFQNNVAAGDLILVGTFHDLGATVAATDTLGNTFTEVALATATGDHDSALFVATSTSSGADTISVTANTGKLIYHLAIAEYSGVEPSSIANMIDASSSAGGGSGTALNSGNITTTNASDLIFGYLTSGNDVANNDFTDNPFFTKREPSSPGTAQCTGTGSNCMNFMDWIATSTVTTAATSTLTIGGDNWSAIAVAFKPKAGTTDFQNLTGGAGTCNGSGAAWIDSTICVKVPAAVSVGYAPTTVTSNGYVSNIFPFNVLSGGVPSTPGTPTYASIASSTATVNWTSATGTTYYKIEKSTDGNSFAQVTTGTALTYSATGTANSLFYYRVRGNNANGDGSYSASSSVLMLPDKPGTPTYSGTAATTVTVNWTLPTGGASSTKIEKSTDGNTFAQVATSSGTTYNATGTASTSYWYRVRVTNTSGDSVYSASSSVTMSPPNSAPNAPSQDTPANAATGQSTTPVFQMTATDPDSDTVQYKVIIYSDNGCTTVVQTNDETASQTGWSGQNASSSTSYSSGSQGNFTTQTALSVNTTYYWKASAIDPAGSNTWTNSATCNSFTTVAGGSLSPSGLWTLDSGSWSISSNAAVVTPGGSAPQMHVTGQSQSNGVVEFKMKDSAASGIGGGVVRADTGADRYRLANGDFGGGNTVIGKDVSNVFSTITSQAATLNTATYYEFRGNASGTSGTTLRSWINGGSAISGSDSTLSSGFIGLMASSTSGTFTFDNFAFYSSPFITFSGVTSSTSWSVVDNNGVVSCQTTSTWNLSTYTGQVPINYDNGGGKIEYWANGTCSGAAAYIYPTNGSATDIFGGDIYTLNNVVASGNGNQNSVSITVSAAGLISY